MIIKKERSDGTIAIKVRVGSRVLNLTRSGSISKESLSMFNAEIQSAECIEYSPSEIEEN